MAVVSATVSINGVAGPTDTTAPYQFTTTAPVGASSVTIGASAIDLGSNIGTAADLQVNVIPDPLTTVVGRVVDSTGNPVAGAAVACLAESSLSGADGSFSVPGVRTIQPLIFCGADSRHRRACRCTASPRAWRPSVPFPGRRLRLLAVPVITSIGRA